MWCKVVSAFGAVGDAQMVIAPALMKDATRHLVNVVLSHRTALEAPVNADACCQESRLQEGLRL